MLQLIEKSSQTQIRENEGNLGVPGPELFENSGDNSNQKVNTVSTSAATDDLTEFNNFFTLKIVDWGPLYLKSLDWGYKISEQQKRIDFYTKELQLAAEKEREHLANSTVANAYFTDLTALIITKESQER